MQNLMQQTEMDELTDFSLKYIENENGEDVNGDEYGGETIECEQRSMQFIGETAAKDCFMKNDICMLTADVSEASTTNPLTPKSGYISFSTPMMFSRYSSLDSLPSVETEPFDESDCSRITSGNISPSDIPDSPTEFMFQNLARNAPSQLTNQLANTFYIKSTHITPGFHSPSTEEASANDMHWRSKKHKQFRSDSLSLVEQSQSEDSDLSSNEDEDTVLLKNCVDLGINRILCTRNADQRQENSISSGDSCSELMGNDLILLDECWKNGVAMCKLKHDVAETRDQFE